MKMGERRDEGRQRTILLSVSLGKRQQHIILISIRSLACLQLVFKLQKKLVQKVGVGNSYSYCV